MKRQSVYIIIISIIFNACSTTTTIYNSDFTLTNNQAKSLTTDLLVNIPVGWFTSQASEEKFIDLWLIRDDYSASIIFQPIYFEDQNVLYDNVAMEKIFDLVKVKSETDGNTNLTSNRSFVLFGNSLLAFEFINKNHERCRTVIFLHKEQYFQCTATTLSSQIAPGELFTIQNSVLKSIFASK
jgi:hypothetical protein